MQKIKQEVQEVKVSLAPTIYSAEEEEIGKSRGIALWQGFGGVPLMKKSS